MHNNGRGTGPIPPRWLNCPRKSDGLVASRFLVLKTPLDERYNDQVPIENRFSPAMLFSSMKQYKVKIGLWVDLTNTNRFYNKQQVEDNDCKYVKIGCRGHGECPDENAVKEWDNIIFNKKKIFKFLVRYRLVLHGPPGPLREPPVIVIHVDADLIYT